MINVTDIRSALVTGQFGNADLIAIQEALTFARNQLARRNTGQFLKGDTVKFKSSRNNQFYQGVIEKVNIKNILVRTPVGVYRVPANMVETV